MEGMSRYQAAGAHLLSSVIGLATLFVGISWIEAGGEPAAVPVTFTIIAVVVLAPITIGAHWRSRNPFVDAHIRIICRFMTSLGLAGLLLVGVPALISWALPSGADLWGAVTVLPYLSTMVLSVLWVFFEIRAALLAMRGSDDPYPEWFTSAPSIG
jgi:uncharacterized Tic20 family protein